MSVLRRSPRLQKECEDAQNVTESISNENSPASVETLNADSSNCADDLVENLKKLNLTEEKRKTALVYDNFMMKHKILSDSSHVEDPHRIKRIYDELKANGLVDQCRMVPSRHATVNEISLVHEVDYIKLLEETSTRSKHDMINFERQFNSVYYCSDSYKCATMAVGSLLNVVDSVVTGQTQNGIAVIRPPGHHAEADYPLGFCFFNNVAVAAKYAQEQYDLKRVLILDWDIHHGNGTQNTFYNTSEVLYISLHRYDNGYFFPVKVDSNYNHIGEGRGKGYNVNIAWNKRKMGDSEYLAAFSEVVMPIAAEYKPELVLVSAGFDAAEGDPLGGYKVTPEGYARMTYLLSTLADGRVILALEGGYNLTSISRSMAACAKVLLGEEPTETENLKPIFAEAGESINNVIRELKPFWKCFGNSESSECETNENFKINENEGKQTATDSDVSNEF